MPKRYGNLYGKITSFENLYEAYLKAAEHRDLRGEVLDFTARLEENLTGLHLELAGMTYKRGRMRSFYVHDPVKRLIMAAPFRDRVVDWAIYRILNPIVDRRYIDTSYGCREGRGPQAAMKKLQEYIRLQCGTAIIGKMDIAKYFYRIDHGTLMGLWQRVVKDRKVLWLLKLTLPEDVLCGIDLANMQMIPGVGMPIGSLPSQMHANFCLNPLDQFIKHDLKARHYIRYMDDMCIVGTDKKTVRDMMEAAREFARERLHLEFNRKTCIRTETQGIDFCGYRVWRDHIRLRKSSAIRMKHHIRWMRKQYAAGNISLEQFNSSLQSHLGQIQHCDGFQLRSKLLGSIVLRREQDK
ncbi:MAG: group II intron reverse transcriptase domain-containing protein [Selenomonadaceae bacterium]|nr:group II intron reverse transcriptase domain-containing protein [Selenomonadaceae bacterium]